MDGHGSDSAERYATLWFPNAGPVQDGQALGTQVIASIVSRDIKVCVTRVQDPSGRGVPCDTDARVKPVQVRRQSSKVSP